MKEHRWTHKLIIKDIVEGERDEWGHKAAAKYVVIGECWAHVVPLLNAKIQAIVRVKTPFNRLSSTAQISWNDLNWKVISGPIDIPGNIQLAQFKMEEVGE